MIYLIQGNALKVCQSLIPEGVFPEYDDEPDAGLGGSKNVFFGTKAQKDMYDEIWQSQEPSPGMVTAENVLSFLGSFFLKEEHEQDENVKPYLVLEDVAYLNTQHEPSHLVMSYRKDDPSQWLLGIMRQTHLPPGQRSLFLVSSKELGQHLEAGHAEFQKKSVDLAYLNHEIELDGLIKSSLLSRIIKQLINSASGEVNTDSLSIHWYYLMLSRFAALGIHSDLSDHFINEQQFAVLILIDKISDEHCKTLCLILWIKGELSEEELQDIILVMEQSPFLAQLLIDLHQKNELIDLEKLKLYAINYDSSMRLYLKNAYKQELKEIGFIKGDLKQLESYELSQLHAALEVIKDVDTVKQKVFYERVVKKDNKGQLLRLILPGFSKIENEAFRTELLELLYTGVVRGSISLAIEQNRIDDTELSTLVANLYQRFICISLMQDLSLDYSLIHLASEENSVHSNQFRQVIFIVEASCKKVHELLRESLLDRDKIILWQHIEKQYRKDLYAIAYKAITTPGWDIHEQLDKLQQRALDAVDPPLKDWFLKTLIVIANALITSLSLGLANCLNKKYNGHYWFFTQTRSGEALRALEKEVTTLVLPSF